MQNTQNLLQMQYCLETLNMYADFTKLLKNLSLLAGQLNVFENSYTLRVFTMILHLAVTNTILEGVIVVY
jgi:hypothetical protein